MNTFFFAVLAFTSFAAGPSFKSEVIVQGFNVIWSMAELPDGKILFTTRNGEFHVLNLQTKGTQKLKADIKVYNRGEGGLLDVTLHPDYVKNKKIYFTYSCEIASSRNTTCLATAILNEKGNQLESIREIFVAKPALDSSAHFGSRLEWDGEKHLLMTMGERFSSRDSAQDLKSDLGKILTINDAGKAEVWSYGHRNPQGLFYEKSTNTLWEHEHGERGGDEINKIEKGKNYGWPVITYSEEYTGGKIGEGTAKAGMEQPLHTYTPSIAPSGLIAYSGKKYPELKGHLLLGALAGQHVNKVEFTDGKVKETKLFDNLHERVRELLETSDGEILFSTDSGKIFKFKRR